MHFERSRRQFKEINLTALIDIVFHLMVFVMLTTSFVVAESMELALPSDKAAASVSAAPVATMRIEILSDGSVVADGRSMNLEHLTTALAARIAADANTRLMILTTPGVSVQQLISVMDAVYLTGGRNVQVDKVG